MENSNVDYKQEKYELTITAENVHSTDRRFTMNNLSLGDNYKPIDVYFQKADGTVVRRKRSKSESPISNRTLPKLVCQIFESQLDSLSDNDKKNFPICRYSPKTAIVRGIYPTKDEYKRHNKTIEMMTYKREDGPQFVFYAWNVFSTLVFARECLKRFGDAEDRFVLIYRDKTEQEKKQPSNSKKVEDDVIKTAQESKNPYSKILLESKNIILRGAPGTGKSYLAKAIAADIISNGYTDQYANLTVEQRKQVEFVQFHPSYDYSDFVEGLRPKMNDDGTMGFELQDGVFKRFVDRARKNYEDSQKTKEEMEQEITALEAISDFFDNINFGVDSFKTITGNEFFVTNVDDKHVYVSIPGNESANKLTLSMLEIKKLVESGQDFNKISDITRFFGKQFATQGYSYDFAICKAIKKHKISKAKSVDKTEELKKFIFIIDEINRGEISKILGELFYAIDPGYRGIKGEVSTQYANMHADPDEKFYVPENVYIIGTMNDIDRSVDSFDFATRRRFRFVEIKADATQGMLEDLEDEELKNEAVSRMDRLNAEILKVEDLNRNYQIGASYFLKLKTLSFEELWTDSLKPLLEDYVRGLYDEKGKMEQFAHAYGYIAPSGDDSDEGIQN